MNNSSNSRRRISFGLESKRFGLVSASGVGPCGAFSCLNLFVAICSLFLAWFTREYYCYSLESFITPEKGIIFGDYLLDKISRV